MNTFESYFILATILFGYLTLYLYRNEIDITEEEMCLEKEKKQKAEAKREQEFNEKFPFLAKLNMDYAISENWMKRNYFVSLSRALIAPFIWIARLPYLSANWMYKEGLEFSIPLIIISALFIMIKIGIPVIYTGSYIDEYNHILSGAEFIKSMHFAEIYHGSYYERGAYVSVLVGLFMYLFGETIFAAKMLPATIGIINFFLLFSISRKISHDKCYTLLILAVYTLTPWFIFNHFYIRMYVFYEFFMLFLTLIFLLIIENITNIKKIASYSALGLSTLLIVYFFSHDLGMYMVLLYSSVFLIYIYFFQIEKIPVKNRLYVSFSNNNILKTTLFFSIIILAFVYMDVSSLIGEFIYGDLAFTSSMNHKYDSLFFNLNTIYTIFFMCSPVFLILKKINTTFKLIISSSLFIFLLHYNSSIDMQMVRIIIYFLPLFYLVSTFTVMNYISLCKNKSVIILILLLLLTTNLYGNYPENFFSEAPYIPTEVVYRDYKDASLIINEMTNDNTILITNLPHIYRFYSDKQNEIYFMRDDETSFYNPKLKYQDAKGTYYYTASNDPIIVNDEMLLDILKNENVLLLLDSNLYNSWITKESREVIEKKFDMVAELKGIKIYEKI